MKKILIPEELFGLKSHGLEEDDLADRLNSRYTVRALVLCILIILAKTYVGKPINCWTPAQFQKPHNTYANSICWLKGTYYLPTEEITIPDRSKPRLYHISYYQWTTYILFGMSLLFYAPKIFWHALTRQSGLDLRRLTKAIKEDIKGDKGLDIVKKSLNSYLDYERGRTCCGGQLKNFNFRLVILYFLIKVLYFINCLGQFFLLNAFLSFQFSSYGFEVLSHFFRGGDLFESPRFPRVTMCDFMIRHLGSNQHWYVIQCTLPINLFNEKIFLCIWFWLLVLTFINFISIILWIISMTRSARRRDLNTYLADDSFMDYLHADGYLVFRIIAQNTDEYTAKQILQHLYEKRRTIV